MPPPSLPLIVYAPPGAGVGELRARLVAERAFFQRQLARVGAILFRGYGISGASELAELVAAAGGERMRYVGGDSPRTDLGGDVYTSTECPPAIRIPLHNEMSYLREHPRHLWFACATPAERGGETTLADGRAVFLALDPHLRARFLRLGVRYRCSFRGASLWWGALDRVRKVTKTWMEAFETGDRARADAHCRRLATRHRWLPSGRLVLELDRPAALEHEGTGDPAWFNQAHLFRLNPRHLGWRNYALARLVFAHPDTLSHDARFGDGSAISRRTLDHLFDVLEAHTVPVRWHKGDALWLDNVACMHGRNPFRGERRLLVAMTR